MTSPFEPRRYIRARITSKPEMSRLLPAIVLLLSLGAVQSSAQVTGSVDIVQGMMQAYGIQVKRSTDQAGDPMLTSRLEGIDFDVYFYGCTLDAQCDSVQFSTGFNLPNGMTLAQVNDWNRDRRYGKAYTDDSNNPYIEYDINLSNDGVGTKNFDVSLEIWRSVITDFRNYIGW